MARINVHLKADSESLKPKPTKSITRVSIASRGPITAPTWSMALSKPNDFPLMLSWDDAAIRASLGAVLIPLPTLSAILISMICHAALTSPVSGLKKEDIAYPIRTRIFLFPVLSEIIPLTSFSIAAVVSATPSIIPSITAPEPSAATYTGISG